MGAFMPVCAQLHWREARLHIGMIALDAIFGFRACFALILLRRQRRMQEHVGKLTTAEWRAWDTE
jgi:hypothetical protein